MIAISSWLQVASILRSAGQECIRVVVARPIDPADINQPVGGGVVVVLKWVGQNKMVRNF